ncbi:putative transcriptional regulator [Shigella flexneri]|nr:putative transcriptional regulator [Shigella flexneri]
MRSLADFEFNKAPLCEGMILACEAIRRDFPSQDVYDELERLVSLAKEEISQLLPLEEQLEKLIALFYGVKPHAAFIVFPMHYGWTRC